MGAILAHQVLRAEGAEPRRSALLVHGILGSLGNWRSFARRLAEGFPDWQIVLVDLRGHGDSPAGEGPHTVSTCAADLEALAGHLGAGPELVCAHSFGGKVALEYARRRPEGLRRVWVLDSPPGARRPDRSDVMEQSAVEVIAALRKVPQPVRSRKDLIDRLLALGLSRTIALWMTTNLAGGEDGYRWRFDLDAVEEMLGSYLAEDLWPVVERPPQGVRLDFVRAERSGGWPEEDLERFRRLEQGSRVRLHPLRDAGHWVHVDNPDGLFELLAPSFSEP